MKAAICTKYGSPEVLEIREVEKPAPKPNEVLVKMHAAAVTMADIMMRKGEPAYARLMLGLTKPKMPIPGTGFSGEIEAVGSEVKQLKAGDAVFGETGMGFGAYAEYVCVQEDGLLTKLPENMNHEQAAPVCDGVLTALNFLRNVAKTQSGQKVLINGASGSVGSAAVQLARHLGAEVTGVCSTTNVELVKALGAEKVIDYTKEDFTQSGQRYDIIFDTTGKATFGRCKGILTEKGIFMSSVLSLPLLLHMMWTSKIGSQKARFSATGLLPVPQLRKDLEEMKGLIETGKIRLHLDKSYPFEHIVEAHKYVDTGRKKGNVVVKFV